jgi:hypothetical protein
MDLFEFFKENESKLQEKPPEQVWQRLEQKLKKARRRRILRRDIRFLNTGTAALVLLFLLLTAILVWYFVRHGQ